MRKTRRGYLPNVAILRSIITNEEFVLFLLVIIAVQSYGIYGASQASRIVYTCELEIGRFVITGRDSSL